MERSPRPPFWRRLRSFVSLPLIIVLIITVIILLPAYSIIYNSFTSLGFGINVGFTLRNYITAFSDPEFSSLFVTSFVFALGTSLFSISVSTILAWSIARTDMPLQKVIELVPVLPLLFPPVLKIIAWIYLLAPRSGILNCFLSNLFGTQITLFNAFSLPAMIWTLGLAEIPTAFLLIVPAFSMQDPSLEEAASLSGAGPARTLFRITLPLAFPSILTAFLLMFILGLGAFETPALMGIPAGIYVFVSRIYDAVEVRFNPGLATAYSTILMLMTVFLVGVYVWSVRRAEKYATVVGRSYNPRKIRLGRWKYVALFFVVAYLTVAVVLPYGVVAITSVIPYYEYGVFQNFVNFFTWDNYVRVLNHPTFKGGMINSLVLGLSAAAITVPLSAVMAHVIHRGAGGGAKRVFEFTGTLPRAFPGVLLGLGLLWAFFGTPFYGSFWGMLVVYIIVFTPYTLRTLSAAVIRIHKELEESATVHGGSWLYNFRRITMPLLKPALAAAFFFILIQVQRRVGEAVLLTGPNVQVAPVVVFYYFRKGEWADAAAASLVLATVVLAYVLVARYVLKVRFTAEH